MSDAQPFPYSEALFAEQRGISRTDCKFFRDRHLKEDADWRIEHGAVMLSVGGFKKLWRHSSGSRVDLSACLPGPAKKNGALVSTILLGDTFNPIPETVKITRICENPQVVLAMDEHSRVRSIYVGRNGLFSVGMAIKVVPHLQQPGWWRYAGALPQRRYSADEWARRQRAGLTT